MTTLRLPMVAMLSLALAACGTSREIRVLDDDAAAEAPAVEAKKERRDVAAAPPRPMPTAADIAAAPNPLTLKGAAVDAVEATLGPPPCCGVSRRRRSGSIGAGPVCWMWCCTPTKRTTRR